LEDAIGGVFEALMVAAIQPWQRDGLARDAMDARYTASALGTWSTVSPTGTTSSTSPAKRT